MERSHLWGREAPVPGGWDGFSSMIALIILVLLLGGEYDDRDWGKRKSAELSGRSPCEVFSFPRATARGFPCTPPQIPLPLPLLLLLPFCLGLSAFSAFRSENHNFSISDFLEICFCFVWAACCLCFISFSFTFSFLAAPVASRVCFWIISILVAALALASS